MTFDETRDEMRGYVTKRKILSHLISLFITSPYISSHLISRFIQCHQISSHPISSHLSSHHISLHLISSHLSSNISSPSSILIIFIIVNIDPRKTRTSFTDSRFRERKKMTPWTTHCCISPGINCT